jgi:hypothetical protein
MKVVGQDRSTVTRSGDESRQQAVPELTPVEMGPPPLVQTASAASLVVELGTIHLEQRPGWKSALQGREDVTTFANGILRLRVGAPDLSWSAWGCRSHDKN